jgi:hypothetical protein
LHYLNHLNNRFHFCRVSTIDSNDGIIQFDGSFPLYSITLVNVSNLDEFRLSILFKTIPKDGSDSLRYTATPRLASGSVPSNATKS